MEKSRLEFAQRLASMLGLSRLVVKAAASLPSPAAGSAPSSNAYQRSYLYVHAENTLYVHLKRLERSGDVGTVMVHALSHIKVSDVEQQIHKLMQCHAKQKTFCLLVLCS